MATPDVTREVGRKERCKALQGRIADVSAKALGGEKRWTKAKELYVAIRKHLIVANERGLIEEPEEKIQEFCRFSDEGHPDIEQSTHSIAYGNGANFDRDFSWPHLTRKRDKAWFDFQISVREERREVTILAYDFEIRFPGNVPVEFVRMDLNGPDHANEHEGVRSHMHVSCDDDGFVVPTLILDPYELLDVMLHGVLRVGKQRSPRTK